MLTQQNTILQFDTSVLDHVSAATIHPLSKCKQGMLLHHWKYTLTDITHVACWSSFSMHGIHFAQTFLLPTCFRRMQNMLTADIPMSAAIAVHVMLLSSSGTAAKCSTSLICHGCRCTTASSISYIFPPSLMAFIHQQTVPYDATWLHSPSCMRSWLHHGAFLSRKWKVHTWETSLQSFSVPCSAASERTNNSFVSPLPNTNTVATQ